MRQIKAIIVDDEEILRKNLRKKLQILWPEIFICGEAGDGRSALDLIENHNPEIVFLDIKMPGMSGIEVARKLVGKCLVVFITAFDKYAVEAFESEAIDYILKPITDDKMIKMKQRLENKISASLKTSNAIMDLIEKFSAGAKKTSQFLQWIKVKQGENIQLVSVNDIYYFRADNKYTLLRTKEKEFLIRKTVTELLGELDPEKFWQIHRATIVNVNCIEKVSSTFTARYEIKLKDIKETLIVSRAFVHLFKQM